MLGLLFEWLFKTGFIVLPENTESVKMDIVEDGKVDASQKDLIVEKDGEDCQLELKVQDEKNI